MPFRHLFFRPGLAAAVAHTEVAADARSRGAQVAYWDMSLKAAVGTPTRPADPSSVAAAAGRLASAAADVTGCATPTIGLNELFGAQLRTPWRPSNAQYRADVLELVRDLAEHGARPHLFVSEPAATAGPAGAWWRSVAEVATVVREVYIPATTLAALGRRGSAAYLQFQLRRAVRNLTTIGIPTGHVGLALGFQPDRSGRNGLPAAQWFEVVKSEGLAAAQVAAEFRLDSVWSWGWATFDGNRADPATAAAACVYLWARDPALCNGPAAAGPGFDSLRSQPARGRGHGNASLRVLSSGRPVWLEVLAAPKLTARVAYVQERTARRWTSLRRVVLVPFRPVRVPLTLARGRHLLRLHVAPEDGPAGAAFSTRPVLTRVR